MTWFSSRLAIIAAAVLAALAAVAGIFYKGQAAGRRKEREGQRAEADRIEQKDKDLVQDLRNDSYDDAVDRL